VPPEIRARRCSKKGRLSTKFFKDDYEHGSLPHQTTPPTRTACQADSLTPNPHTESEHSGSGFESKPGLVAELLAEVRTDDLEAERQLMVTCPTRHGQGRMTGQV
jgi:hypothetical protein